jgi:hypothetical protein
MMWVVSDAEITNKDFLSLLVCSIELDDVRMITLLQDFDFHHEILNGVIFFRLDNLHSNDVSRRQMHSLT